MTRKHTILPLIVASLTSLITACATPWSIITVTPRMETSSPSPPTPQSGSPTPLSPTATTAPPSVTPPPQTAPPTILPTATPSSLTVQVFLIALEDNGKSGKLVGCGDSVVPVQVEIPYTQGVLKAALEELLSIKEPYYGESGLYNALYQSDLRVESVTIRDGEAVIHLTGTVMVAGVCDNPRVAAQIEETARQFPTVDRVAVLVNGVPLDDILSLKGD